MIKAIVRTVLVLLLFILTIIAFLLTPTGLRASVYAAHFFLPGQLTVKKLSGIIIGPLKAKEIKYKTDAQTIEVQNFEFNWSPSKLLDHTFKIKHLHAKKIIITQRSIKKDSEPLEQKVNNFVNEIKNLLKSKPKYKIKLNSLAINNLLIKDTTLKPHSVIQIKSLFFNHTARFGHQAFRITGKLIVPLPISFGININGTQKKQFINANLLGKHTLWKLMGTNNKGTLTLSTKSSKFFSGSLSGKLTINKFHIWQGQIHGKSIDLTSFNKMLPNAINFSWESTGTIDHALKTKNKFSFSYLKNHLSVILNFNKTLFASWKGNLPFLEDIDKNIKGDITTAGQMSGTYPHFTTSGFISAKNFSAFNLNAKQIKGEWLVNLSPKKISQLKLTTQSINYGKDGLKSLNLSIHGNLKNQHMKLQAIFPKRTVKLKLAGRFAENTWHGIINQMTLQDSKETWEIAQPTPLQLSKQSLVLGNFCLRKDKTSFLCANGNWDVSQPFAFKLKGRKLPLSWISSWVSNTINIKGHFSLNGSYQKTLKTSEATLAFETQKPIITINSNGSSLTQSFHEIKLNTRYSNDTISTKATIKLNKKDGIHVDLQLPHPSITALIDKTQQMKGHINAHFHSLQWIKNWVPGIYLSKGSLKANIGFSGQINNPSFTGSLNMMDTQVDIPKPNLVFKNIIVELKGLGDQLSFHAKATSGGQPIQVSGSFSLSKKGKPLKLHLKTDNTKLINLKEYQATLTSDINITVAEKDIHLDGTIEIPQAEIKPIDLHSTVTLPTNDIIYVNQPKKKNPSDWNVFLNITLKLGKKVHIQVKGINAYTSGQIELTKTPDTTTLATGKITLDKGVFSLYGKTLKLTDNSTINFAHSLLSNPLLNVEATKEIPISSATGFNVSGSKITVGVSATGNLKSPKITFFSRPPGLSQSEVLSYIILGYANQSSGTSGNTDFLLRALQAAKITSEGLLGKENIADEIQQGLGLSELGVESETSVDALGNPLSQQSAFVVGKHLTKNLYLRYSFGITDPVNVFQVRYIINKNWSVQADSSVLGNGADILYTIEKD